MDVRKSMYCIFVQLEKVCDKLNGLELWITWHEYGVDGLFKYGKNGI